MTTTQIHQQRPDWDLWRDGCPHGESVEQVEERASAFLNRALVGDGPVVAFSHGHFLRALTLAFLGFPSEAGARLSLDTAGLSVLRRTEQGRLLQLWNDTGHLPGLSA